MIERMVYVWVVYRKDVNRGVKNAEKSQIIFKYCKKVAKEVAKKIKNIKKNT